MEDGFNCAFISWDDIHTLSRIVAKGIRKAKFQPDVIIGLARGGFVPSRNLSDLLGVKDLISLKIGHWGEVATKDGKAELKYPIKFDLTGKKVLIVDDITDTGESMIVARDYIQSLGPSEIKTAVLMHINHSKFTPDFYAEDVEDWTWFIFPWCFVEDAGHLINKVLENGEHMSLSSIKRDMEKRFQIKIKYEPLLDLLEELEHRNLIEKIGNNVWKKCKV